MSEISLFYGIRVTMYYDDHIPPLMQNIRGIRQLLK